ncbi:MAG: thioredoxin family protein [Polyangiaceae bacterium]
MRFSCLLLSAAIALGASGCGKSSGSGDGAAASVEDAFRDRSDAEVSADLAAAKEKARNEGKRVLLEFVAPWCQDCREVARLAAEEPAASALRELYVVVPVNVGRFDRNKALLREHGIKLIAALVVLDADGKTIAKTTLEPITGKKKGLTSEDLAAWLRSPRRTDP